MGGRREEGRLKLRTGGLAMSVAFLILLPACGGGGLGNGACGLNLGGLPVPECSGSIGCTSVTWIVHASGCSGSCPGIVAPEIDLGASPPEARLRVGDASYLAVWPVNLNPPGCTESVRSGGNFQSSNPAVAAIEQEGPAVFQQFAVRAVSPGRARILEGTSQLAACPSPYTDCTVVSLILRVMP